MRPLPSVSLALAILAAAAPAQESKSPLAAADIVLGYSSTPFTALFDFDGDGDLDTFGDWTNPADKEFMRLEVRRNTGAGVLINVWSEIVQEVGPQTKFARDSQVAAAELTGDGKDDLVIANRFFVRLYTGGPGGLVLAREWRGLPRVQGLVLADVDGDGGKDIAVLTRDDLRVYSFDGSAWSLLEKERLSPKVATDMLLAVEAGATPGSELAVVTAAGVQFFAYDEGRLAGIGPAQVLGSRTAIAGVYPHELSTFMAMAGDVTGNGLDDVVIFSPEQRYRVLRQVQPGEFRMDELRAGGPATGLADVDGDGDLDGICCGGGGGGLAYPDLRFESNFEISINRGDGHFDKAFQIRGSGADHIGGAGDIDGDGDVDLLAGRVIFFNRGFDCLPMQPATTTPGLEPEMLLDADGDGDMDAGLTLTSLMRNDGGGVFTSMTPTVAAAPPGTAFVGPGLPGDFDGDQHPDLLVEHWQGGTFLGTRLLLNDGHGQFTDGGAATGAGVAIHPSGLEAHGFRRQDVDGDGDLDLITIVQGTSNDGSTIWLNDGAGFFTQGDDFSVATLGKAYFVLHVADFDGDLIPDALSTTETPNPLLGTSTWDIQMHLGLPGGGFAAPFSAYQLLFGSPFSFGVDPAQDRIVVHDFTGDGLPDIVGFDVNSNSGAWLFEDQGNGIFWGLRPLNGQEASSCGQGGGNRVDLVELNGDAYPDLIVHRAECQSESSFVFLGTASGLAYFSAWQLVSPDVLFDVDGDGDTDAYADVLVRNQTANPCAPPSVAPGGPRPAGPAGR